MYCEFIRSLQHCQVGAFSRDDTDRSSPVGGGFCAKVARAVSLRMTSRCRKKPRSVRIAAIAGNRPIVSQLGAADVLTASAAS